MASYGVTVPEAALIAVCQLARERIIYEASLSGYGPGIKALRTVEQFLIGSGFDPGRARHFDAKRYPALAREFPWWVTAPDVERGQRVKAQVAEMRDR